jgi:hypothetical protein
VKKIIELVGKKKGIKSKIKREDKKRGDDAGDWEE